MLDHGSAFYQPGNIRLGILGHPAWSKHGHPIDAFYHKIAQKHMICPNVVFFSRDEFNHSIYLMLYNESRQYNLNDTRSQSVQQQN